MPIKPQAYRQGTGHKGSKLTDDLVRQIRKERKEGAPIKALSEKFNVAQSSISQICSRTIWTHVQDTP